MTRLRPLLYVLGSLLSATPVSVSAAPLGAFNFSLPVPEEVPARLDATLSKEKFAVDESVELTVALTNTGDKDIYLGLGGDMYSAFNVTVTPARTQPAWLHSEGVTRAGALTAFGQRMFAQRSLFADHTIILPPKATQRIVFPLQRMFDLSNGGDYTVSVSRTFKLVRNDTVPKQPQGAGGFSPASYRREFEVKLASPQQFSIASPEDVSQKVSSTPSRGL